MQTETHGGLLAAGGRPAKADSISDPGAVKQERRRLLERRGVERQLDHERRAVPGLGLDADAAAVALDDPVREREAEPRPDADRLGGEEGIEDAGLHLGRDAGAVVVELEADAVVAAAGLDADLALAVDRVAGVHQQIQEDLIQLAGIAAHARQIVRNRAPR